MSGTHSIGELVRSHTDGHAAQSRGGNQGGSTHPLGDTAAVKRVWSAPSPSAVLTRQKLLHSLGPLFGLLFFVVALWVLHHELQEYHYRDVVRHVEELPARRLFLALVLTVTSYFLLTGYDALASRYIRHPLAYGKIALASFIGYAFSHSMGFSLLSGGSVRYRLYATWGLSAGEIATVVAFNGLTFWLGILALEGVIFLWEPLVIPSSLRLPFASVRGLGVVFLILVGGYLLFSAFRKTPLRIREWRIPLPPLRLAASQVALSSLDWALAAGVLYVLLPPTGALPYPGFLGTFILAQITGVVSQVPGGLGVFETVILLLLSPQFPALTILGALVAYRGVYYLLPFGVASALLGVYEILQRKEGVRTQNTSANLALLGDKALLFSRSGRAFIMYGVEGRSWVALGDPVSPEEETTELVWQFHELCDRYGGWPVFYQVSVEHLPLYLDLGLVPLKLGEEARVRLDTFSLTGEARKGLRHACNRVEKEGCTFVVIPAAGVPTLLPELKAISDAWLAEKHTREKGFSLGLFDPQYLTQFPVGVVRQAGKIVAFANLWLGAEKEEFSPDLMRHLPEAPAGAMEYLFVQLMLWGKREGYRWFNLGMAPFSGLETRALAPLWHRLGTFLRFIELADGGIARHRELTPGGPERHPLYSPPGGLASPLAAVSEDSRAL